MNKEYMCLYDNEVLVIDENGHAIKRKIENVNVHDVLLIENDLEKINKKIISLEKIIYQDEKTKLTKKEIVIAALIPFIVGMLAYGIASLTTPFSLISDIIPCTISIVLGTVLIDASVIVSSKQYKKHIKGVKSELSTAYQLKDELEKRLENNNEKTKETITSHIVDTEKINSKVNDIVILEESTQFYEKARKQLNESYTTGYQQSGPRLVKKLIPTRNTKNK